MNTAAPVSASVRARRAPLLSEQLEELERLFKDRSATVGEVVDALGDRAFTFLMIIFALPFLVPVSVPGSSTPLGLIIASIAVQLAMDRLPWLPRWLLAWHLPAGFFARVVPVTRKVIRSLERVLHPRYPRLAGSHSVRGAHHMIICVSGLLLALPLPILLTNTLPAWAIVFLALGLLERDGAFICAGYAVFAGTLVFFGLIGSAISKALVHVWHWLAARY